MNTIVTSREAILESCKALVSEDGLSSLNMRKVADRCGVALGSLYNYFPSKSALTLATIESVWQDIFHMERPCKTGSSFPDEVQWIFGCAKTGTQAYPNFFTAHSIGFASEEKGQARQTMEQYFLHMKSGLLAALQRDEGVRPDAFNEHFTAAALVDFVLSSLVTLLIQRQSSCAVLLEMLRRTLY